MSAKSYIILSVLLLALCSATFATINDISTDNGRKLAVTKKAPVQKANKVDVNIKKVLKHIPQTYRKAVKTALTDIKKSAKKLVKSKVALKKALKSKSKTAVKKCKKDLMKEVKSHK